MIANLEFKPLFCVGRWLAASCGLILILVATGCASAGYRRPTAACTNDYSAPATAEIARETRARALRHPAYAFIPFQRSQMYWCDPRHVTWYFCGNDADGIFGEGMSGEHPYSTNINCLTWVRWSVLRNAGHNMMFYPPLGSACFEHHWNWSLFKADGAGVAALARDRTGVFGEGRSSFKLNLNDLKPFLSVKLGRFESYIGWRERGNFGMACRLERKKQVKEEAVVPNPDRGSAVDRSANPQFCSSGGESAHTAREEFEPTLIGGYAIKGSYRP